MLLRRWATFMESRVEDNSDSDSNDDSSLTEEEDDSVESEEDERDEPSRCAFSRHLHQVCLEM